MKTSGVEAEYGGALGGVVNVILDKGTNKWHGAVFTYVPGRRHERFADGVPALRSQFERNLHRLGSDRSHGPGLPTDPAAHQRSSIPGFTVGGPIADLFPRIYGISDAAYQTLQAITSLCLPASTPSSTPWKKYLNHGPNGGVTPVQPEHPHRLCIRPH